MKRLTSRSRLLRIFAAAIFFVAAVFSFVSGCRLAELLMHLQFGGALVSLVTAFSCIGLAVVGVTVILTYFFGRFYCSVFCPFGILQDLIGFVFRCKRSLYRNLRKTRYVVAFLCVGLLLGGSSLGFVVLGPYSNFGSIVTAVVLWVREGFSGASVAFWVDALLPLLVIVALVIWKRRVFCTTLCPVGTVLGLFAKHGVYRMSISDACVDCGLCQSVCPVGCIDSASRSVDNERCVRCMNCTAVCCFGAVALGRGSRLVAATVTSADDSASVDVSRRAFCVDGAVAVAALALGASGGYALSRLAGGVQAASGALSPVADGGAAAASGTCLMMPPGGGVWSRFSAKCISCQLCVAVCPSGIIVPGNTVDGGVRIDLSHGYCRYDCNRCNEVCPTDALLPLSLAEKQKTQIGVASFSAEHCRTVQDEQECGLCVKACPTGALELRTFPTGLSIPRLTASKCIGCGACQDVCPVSPKAMTVGCVDKQSRLG